MIEDEEVRELINKLSKMENAPLIWINGKVQHLEDENKELQKELQRKDNIIKDAKEVLLTTNNIEKALNILDRIKDIDNEYK